MGDKDFEHAGLNRARALHDVEDCHQQGRLYLRLVLGPPAAPHPPSLSPLLVGEAGVLEVSRPCASPPLLLLVARWRRSPLLHQDRSQNCLFRVQADALPPPESCMKQCVGVQRPTKGKQLLRTASAAADESAGMLVAHRGGALHTCGVQWHLGS